MPVISGSASGHTAVDLLAPLTVHAMVQKWSETFYSRFKVLELFGYKDAQRMASDHVLWSTVIKLLKQSAGFDAGPKAGERMDFTKNEARLQKTFFKSYQFDVDTNDETILVADPADMGVNDRDLRKQAERRYLAQIANLTEAFWRLFNTLSSGILMGKTDLSALKIANVSGTLNFGITIEDEVATPWSNPNTDIQKRFTVLLRKFREKNGGLPPTHMVYASRFHETYIMENAELRTNFFPYNTGLAGTILGPLLSISENNLGTPLIPVVVDDMIDPVGNGTYTDLTNVWSTNILTLVRQDPAMPTLQTFTARNKDNAYLGGVRGYSYETRNPERTVGVVTGNYVPICENPDAVMPINVTGA